MPSNTNRIGARDFPERIAEIIKKFSDSHESYGYIRFIFKTDNDNAKIMAAFSLDPYAFLQSQSFLVLGENYDVFTTPQKIREIEENINIMSDINAVSFTMKRGYVESYDDLTKCLRKFVQSFAE